MTRWGSYIHALRTSFNRLFQSITANPPSGIWVFAAVLLLTAALLFPYSPALLSPGKDSGVFLYTGWRLLEGDKLYSQVWDHKPPLIYVIQMIGLLLGNGSRWGVWGLEVLFVAAAFYLAWLVLRRVKLRHAGWVTAASLLALYRVATGENFTESYALLPQMAVVYLVLKHQNALRVRHGLLIGILTGVMFGFRQNLIGVGIAACLVAFLWRPSLSKLLAPLAGFALFNALLVLPFAINGTLEEFWAAVYTYNFHYADLLLSQRLAAVKNTLQFMQSDVFFGLALLGWLFFAAWLVVVAARSKQPALQKKIYAVWLVLLGAACMLLAILGDVLRGQPLLHDFGPVQVTLLMVGAGSAGLGVLWWSGLLSRLLVALPRWELGNVQRRLASLAVLWLPIEIILASWSGRNFLHYYIAIVPVGLVILGLSADVISRMRRGAWVALALLVLVVVKPLDLWSGDLRVRHDPQMLAVVNYLTTHTTPNEAVWIWGAEPVVSFTAQRAQPTRFSYLYPLFQFHDGAAVMSTDLKNDILRQPPRVIIDTLDAQTPFPLDPGGCARPEIHLQGEMEWIFAWVCAHYTFSHTLGADNWPVYVHITPEPLK